MSEPADRREVPARILAAISTIIVGRDEIKRALLAALLSGGHVLVEGLPGTAKTMLGKAFSSAIGGAFKRVQGTPDLLPADVTGFYLYTPDGGARFISGPIFANVILADELNRATPRTQSAFLEAMQEGQVTVDGVRHPLPVPFMIIATQVPAGGEGTYPLPGVHADRFMLRAWSGYPTLGEETDIVARTDLFDDPAVPAVTTPEEILAVRKLVKQVHVAPELRQYIVEVVRAVREEADVAAGPGPRASIALYKTARALAFLDGRDFAVPDDVKQCLHAALVHRLRLTDEADMDGTAAEAVIDKVVDRLPVPRTVS